jgi:putative transposase
MSSAENFNPSYSAMGDDWDVSIRWACQVLKVDSSTYRYKSRRHDQAGINMRVEEIWVARVRYGYLHVRVALRRVGWDVNGKKVRSILMSWTYSW